MKLPRSPVEGARLVVVPHIKTYGCRKKGNCCGTGKAHGQATSTELETGGSMGRTVYLHILHT